MRGYVDQSHGDLFVRNRVRVMVEDVQPGPTLGGVARRLFYAEQRDENGNAWPGWYDPGLAPDQGGLPAGADPFVLECQRDVAYAVYKALAEHFEGETPTPTAGDRAYADARTDIDRQAGLIERLVGGLLERPHAVTVPADQVHMHTGQPHPGTR